MVLQALAKAIFGSANDRQIKRFQPRAQGRAFPIHKPMTHITITVADQEA